MSESSVQPEVGAAPERDNDALIGRVIDNRYRILSLLAIGGMGRVYRAEQTSLGRVVALKVLSIPHDSASLDPQFRERFALEAATASRLANPNTVTIFDYGRTDDDLYYLVMEFVEGITLSRLLKTEKRLVTERALQIARQICHSLVEAHARGIIHRDIKPANILLLLPDLEWVKVLDFGIARFTNDASSPDPDAQLTRVGTYVGTPEYMAPESFYSRVDARADIYSIGVMLYLMLTGRVPLQGATHTATIVMAVHDEVSRIDPALGVPPFVESVVMRCLAKKPEDRFQSMAELLNAIASCLVEMGAALHAPTHPTVTGTGVKPTLELTLRPKAEGELPLTAAGKGNTAKWIGAAAVFGVLVAGALWFRPSAQPPGLDVQALPAASSPTDLQNSGTAGAGNGMAPGANGTLSNAGEGPAAPATVAGGSASPASAQPVETASAGSSAPGAPANAAVPLPAETGLAAKGSVPAASVPAASVPAASSVTGPKTEAAPVNEASVAKAESPASRAAVEPVKKAAEKVTERATDTTRKSESTAKKEESSTESKSSSKRKRASSASSPSDKSSSGSSSVTSPVVPEGYKPSPY